MFSGDVEGILKYLQTRGFLLNIFRLRLDALIIFKQSQYTLVDSKNQKKIIGKICWFFKSRGVDFARLKITNASTPNIIMFERKA